MTPLPSLSDSLRCFHWRDCCRIGLVLEFQDLCVDLQLYENLALFYWCGAEVIKKRASLASLRRINKFTKITLCNDPRGMLHKFKKFCKRDIGKSGNEMELDPEKSWTILNDPEKLQTSLFKTIAEIWMILKDPKRSWKTLNDPKRSLTILNNPEKLRTNLFKTIAETWAILNDPERSWKMANEFVQNDGRDSERSWKWVCFFFVFFFNDCRWSSTETLASRPVASRRGTTSGSRRHQTALTWSSAGRWSRVPRCPSPTDFSTPNSRRWCKGRPHSQNRFQQPVKLHLRNPTSNDFKHWR